MQRSLGRFNKSSRSRALERERAKLGFTTPRDTGRHFARSPALFITVAILAHFPTGEFIIYKVERARAR